MNRIDPALGEPRYETTIVTSLSPHLDPARDHDVSILGITARGFTGTTDLDPAAWPSAIVHLPILGDTRCEIARAGRDGITGFFIRPIDVTMMMQELRAP